MIVTLKDGSKKEYAEAKSVIDIAYDISEGLARAALSLIHISLSQYLQIYISAKELPHLLPGCIRFHIKANHPEQDDPVPVS